MQTEIPIFPLNAVLFPGTPIPLHIFEERYKNMINRCLAENQPFGINLIAEGQEAHGPLAQTVTVGCSAQISNYQKLPLGKINLVALGGERYRIVEFNRDLEYLQASVEFFDEVPVEFPESTRQNLQANLIAYFDALQIKADLNELLREKMNPWQLANLAASVMQTPLTQKQSMLEIESRTGFVERVQKELEKETILLKALKKAPKTDTDKPYSLN